ncbi:hypothetical protein [Robinsoniella peoriensis]|uniref:Uncharacterized protein n=1 Tax=Robinsoniella peoriensis TaxID=180332 RepID=A0A4U8QBE7_9FIRM|nr:hypothetical protein DSM106044_01026 [Robinsoniella peoriensis]
MIDIKEFLEYMESGKIITCGSKIHECMHWFSQEALRLTAELNGSYHTPQEIRALNGTADRKAGRCNIQFVSAFLYRLWKEPLHWSLHR